MSRSWWFLGLVVVAQVLAGCVYRDNPNTCSEDRECASGRCNKVTFECDQGGAGGSPATPDGAAGRSETGGADRGDGSAATPSETGTVDAPPPDLPEIQCTQHGDCKDARAPICELATNRCVRCAMDGQCAAKGQEQPWCNADGRCVQCKTNTECGGQTPYCSPNKTCVGCLDNAQCSSAGAPICDAATNACSRCGTDSQCAAKSQTQRWCHAEGRCVQCKTNTECSAPTAYCSPANTCVGCLEHSQCTSSATPVCDANRCAKCTADAQCAAKSSMERLCHSDGTCVQCKSNADCSAPTPGCANNRCVQCTEDAHCSGATPICDKAKNQCMRCSSDKQCVDKLGPNPGVCMAHEDGRCASDAETIYVRPSSECDDNGSGTSAVPLCASQKAFERLTASRRLVVMRPGQLALSAWALTSDPPGKVTVVGQNGATIGPAVGIGITVSAGDVYVRNLTVSGMLSAGIVADGSATLRLNRSMVIGNKGGVYVNGAAFEITNTVVAKNKPTPISTGSPIDFAGVYLKTGARMPQRFANNTVVDNDLTGIYCEGMYPLKSLLANGNVSRDFFGCMPMSSVVGVDPKFDSGKPYHLTASSPCVDMGDPADFAPDDIDGDRRPAGARSDCGADELSP